jgi:hypothetical protein
VYAYTLSFQLFAFVYFRLPPLLILLGCVCALELVRERAARSRATSWLQLVVFAGAAGLVFLGVIVVRRGMVMGDTGPYSRSLEFNLLSFFRLALPLATGLLVVPLWWLTTELQTEQGSSTRCTETHRDSAS